MVTALTLESENLAQTDLCLSAFVCHTHTTTRPVSCTSTCQGTHRGCVTGIMGSGLLLAWGASSSREDMELREPTTEMA